MYFQSDPALAEADPVHVCIFTVKLYHEFAFNLSRKSREIKLAVINRLAKIQISAPGPDLLIGYIGLSLGPQDLQGPPTNCGSHRVNFRYLIISINAQKTLAAFADSYRLLRVNQAKELVAVRV